MEKVKAVLKRFVQGYGEKDGDGPRESSSESILELREDSSAVPASGAASQLSSVPLTQFDNEIEAIMAEIKSQGLLKVAKKRGIILTKNGKVDKRTRIGRVLFHKLNEVEKEPSQY